MTAAYAPATLFRVRPPTPRARSSIVGRPRRPGHGAAAPEPAGPRTLHLDGRASAIRVTVSGPALAFDRLGRRATLPLDRIARVTVLGQVDWSGDALRICLANGVPIVFLSAADRPLGAAMPLVRAPSRLGELIASFVETARWHERYENWARGQRMRVLHEWREASGADGGAIDPARWSEAVRRFVYLRDDTLFADHGGRCLALALTMLRAAGISGWYRGWDGTSLDLGADLAGLLAARIGCRQGNLAHAVESVRPAAGLAFEAGEHEDFLAAVLARLAKRLGDTIEPWP